MRLLNTSTLKLYEFHDKDIPRYAILSHKWTGQEVSLQMLENPSSKTLAGYTKIQRCCELALSEGWKYAWIDTCCIDKTSSADLSEAINAMYGWYENAQVCYVYLADVSVLKWDEEFRISRWFLRGWTLQELLAPRTVVFYSREWKELGTKWSLRNEISRATGITHQQMIDHRRVNIATKMSWAALRETTRIEDTAYSLLGLFDINMPLLYGEGDKAFQRLQHEILQTQAHDESIFAWADAKTYHCGLLARSPKAFALSGNILSVRNPNAHIRPLNVTKRLLTIDGFDSKGEYQLQNSIQYTREPSPYIVLNCIRKGTDSGLVGIELTERDLDCSTTSSLGVLGENSSLLDYFVRSSPGKLRLCESFRGSVDSIPPLLYPRTMTVSLDHIPFMPSNPDKKLATIIPSLQHDGFAPSEKYPRDEVFTNLPSVFPLNFRPEGWKVILDGYRVPIAGIMFRSQTKETFALVLTAKESGVSVDVFLPSNTENLRDVIERVSLYLRRIAIADQTSSQLQVKNEVCASSRKKFMNYELVYHVDIKITPIKAGSSVAMDILHLRP